MYFKINKIFLLCAICVMLTNGKSINNENDEIEVVEDQRNNEEVTSGADVCSTGMLSGTASRFPKECTFTCTPYEGIENGFSIRFICSETLMEKDSVERARVVQEQAKTLSEQTST